MLKPDENIPATRVTPRFRHTSRAGFRLACARGLAGREEGRDVRFG
jgi:hypothetical protein